MSKVVDRLGVLTAVAYVASSDRRVLDDERAEYERILTELGVPEGERGPLRGLLDTAPTLEAVVAGLKEAGDRREAVRLSLQLAHADGRYGAVEAERLEQMAAALGVAKQDIDALEAGVHESLLARG